MTEGHRLFAAPRRRRAPFLALAVALVLPGWPAPLAAQSLTGRGFVETRAAYFPRDASNDGTNLVGDLLMRGELFLKAGSWLQFGAGLDLRANTHEQVEDSWRLDARDAGILRPRLSLRRLTGTVTRGPVTIDLGRQFIRWGKADVITPTDRFAPRDFLNVIDNEFLPVTGARGVFQIGSDSVEVAWVPVFTPSRMPLLDQRWTALPSPLVTTVTLKDSQAPNGSQAGVRWSHVGSGYEVSGSFFDGLDHRPTFGIRSISPPFVEIERSYPALRSYGADGAVPTRWFTIKAEAAYVTSSTPGIDEYVLYVVQVERQSGEWALVGGYSGEVVTRAAGQLAFAPDRGLARAAVGRASYAIDANRSFGVEAAVRQNGRGVFAKAEYSQGRGQHWRATVTGAVIAGRADDFLGQFRRNSYGTLALRYSF